MKRKKAVIVHSIEALKAMSTDYKLKGHALDEVNRIISNLEDSLKSRKEIHREAAWGTRGWCSQFSARLVDVRKKARKTQTA